MKVVARQSSVGGQVVPIHAGARVPAASAGALEARVAQLEAQLARMAQAHNAAIDALNKLSKEHAVLAADHMKVKYGASSLAKHFQGLAVAAAQAGIQYQPLAVQAKAAPQARPAAPSSRPAPASQQTVNAQPVPAAAASAPSVWEQRESLFFEGGEGEEG